MYCKANFKSVAKCKKRLCTAVFALFKKNTRRVAWPVLQSRCKALSALSQNTLKNTKTGRKSVGFLILTQAPKCTRSHCFPPQKHPKNGFVMRFAGKNSFFQLRARDFSFYMNAYINFFSVAERPLTFFAYFLNAKKVGRRRLVISPAKAGAFLFSHTRLPFPPRPFLPFGRISPAAKPGWPVIGPAGAGAEAALPKAPPLTLPAQGPASRDFR